MEAQQPQAQQQPRAATGSLYVGDLPTDLQQPEDTLYQMFNKVGMVMSIKVCRDINTQRSLGYAYVNFQNPQDAEKALEQLNCAEIKPGRLIRVMWSSRDPTLRKSGKANIFVRGLDKSVDTKLLRDTFITFGKIVSVKLAQDNDGGSLGYGFVQFEEEEAATESIERVNGQNINGAVVVVEKFVKKADRVKEEEKVFKNIYLKNVKPEATEESIKATLASYGTAETVFLSPHPQHKTQFALVTMASHEAAVKCIDELHGKSHPELSEAEGQLYCSRAMKKSDRLAHRSATASQQLYQSQGRNIYVKHLDDTITKERLEELFAQFGTITSSALMKDGNANFRGFGFVCFESKESASAAIREMNGKMIFRRPMYVALAQQRDTRHSMLEDQRKSMIAQQQRMSMSMGMYGGGYGYGMGGGFGMPRPGMPPFMAPGPMMFNANATNMRRPMMQPPRQGPGMGGPMRPKMPMGGPMGGQGNMFGGGMPPQARYTQPPPMSQRPQASVNGVTPDMLAKMSPEEQKNHLGERLYSEIGRINPEQAAKITGMLLEMDIPEILHVLEDRNMLNSKVHEAVSVLKQHAERQ